MFTRRNFVVSTFAAATVVATDLASAASKLNWKAIPAGATGFFRAPVLLTGPTEALLIDGGFSYPDGRAVVEAIKASGKKLTAIYITQGDPDYYFSLKPITEAFPGVKVLAASPIVAAIKASVQKKLATWGPQLKENGPQTMADIVMPEVFDGKTLEVDGEKVEVVTPERQPQTRYVWVPSLQAMFGGVLVFSGVHVWTADTPTTASRTAWIATLDEIAARKPEVVVAGHMTPDAPTSGLAGISFTKAYLAALDEELAKVKDSASLKAAMLARYPNLGMGIALDIGAKVVTGEMKWG